MRAVTMLRSGQLYQESALEDATRSIYALGAFSSVTVRGELEDRGRRGAGRDELEARRESQVWAAPDIMSGTTASGYARKKASASRSGDVHLIGSTRTATSSAVCVISRRRATSHAFLDAFPPSPTTVRASVTPSRRLLAPGVIDRARAFWRRAGQRTGPVLLFVRQRHRRGHRTRAWFAKQRLIGASVCTRRSGSSAVSRSSTSAGTAERAVQRGTIRSAAPRSAHAVQIVDRQGVFYERHPVSLLRGAAALTLDLRDDAAKPRRELISRVVAHEATSSARTPKSVSRRGTTFV